jgi:hypothetical protein
MANLKKFTSIFLGIGMTVACLSPTAASANTAPNPYTPVGQSWISVPEASKVYFESFGNQSYDDYAMFYVSAGITCTYNNVTAVGPFLTGQDLGSSECVDGSTNPIDPIENATRAGATPFGSSINFFGTSYASAWPNTNGGIYFNAPSGRYDRTMPDLANEALSSVMFPFGADLFYVHDASNFWTAQTQIDGKSAVIFAWEDFHNCCNPRSAVEDMSFQLVLINQGNGDFNAYFNYDSILGFNQGYRAPQFFVDLETGVTPSSNILVTDDVQFAPVSCTAARKSNTYGTATETLIAGLDNLFLKQESVSSKTISIWSDSNCTTPINFTAIQNVAQDNYAYLELRFSTISIYGVAVGWATFNTVNKKIDWTELLRNQSSANYLNSAASPLTSRSLNTTVPGRFVIGQRGGQTVTEASAIAPAAPASPTVSTPTVSTPAAVTKTAKRTSNSIRFSTSTKFLTKTHMSKLKKSVKLSGVDATYVVTGTAGMLPGVTKAQVANLAKLRANVVKAYLVKLGVKKSNISIKTTITNVGIVPKTKTLAKYLTTQ